MKLVSYKTDYSKLLDSIGSVIKSGKKNALSALNARILLTYWQVGQYIVEFEQHGSERAEYGTALISNLSKDLKLLHGKGFSRSNIQMMRLFYLNYPKYQTSGKLTLCKDKKGVLRLATKRQDIADHTDPVILL